MTVIKEQIVSDKATLTAARELRFSPNLSEDEWQKAFQQGQKKGEEEGYKKASLESRHCLDLIQSLALKLAEQKEQLLEILKPEVMQCSLAICEHIIRKELNHPEAMVQLINSLLDELAAQSSKGRFLIFLASEDVVMLEGHLDKIQYDTEEITAVRFRRDPNLKRGDCRIEAELGLLNYLISRELSHLGAFLKSDNHDKIIRSRVASN